MVIARFCIWTLFSVYPGSVKVPTFLRFWLVWEKLALICEKRNWQYREFVEWKANLLCISLSASAPWRMWGNTTSISCSAESGESLPVQRIPSNWEILENLLFQKHYTECIMWIVTQQHFQKAKFSPLMHASLYRLRAAALIHVLLSFFKLATCHCHAPYNALPASHCNA